MPNPKYKIYKTMLGKYALSYGDKVYGTFTYEWQAERMRGLCKLNDDKRIKIPNALIADTTQDLSILIGKLYAKLTYGQGAYSAGEMKYPKMYIHESDDGCLGISIDGPYSGKFTKDELESIIEERTYIFYGTGHITIWGRE